MLWAKETTNTCTSICLKENINTLTLGQTSAHLSKILSLSAGSMSVDSLLGCFVAPNVTVSSL